MKKRRLALICICILTIITVCTGCETSQGSKTYTRSQAQSALSVYYGTILRVADVRIQSETKGAVGGVAGGILGGVVGSTIGGGGGKKIATTVGALGGAAAGGKAGEKKTKPGVELEVEFDDGRLMVIVQEKDDEYAVGDRIRVIRSPDSTFRVRQ